MNKPFEHTEPDLSREARTGIEEVVFGGAKSVDQLIEIVRFQLSSLGKVLCTRLSDSHLDALRRAFPDLVLLPAAGVAHSPYAPLDGSGLGCVGVVSAGTSDTRTAEEAAVVARYFGCEVTRVNDVGVAGIERLMRRLPELRALDALIVVAGMEGALPGVVAGLVPVPVIAVPTSVGYGASFQGVTALLSMLVSCSPGMSVVNIDNGFGAAVAAVRWLRHLRRKTDL